MLGATTDATHVHDVPPDRNLPEGGNLHPQPGLLTRFSKTPAGIILGRNTTKSTAGFMVGAGVVLCSTGVGSVVGLPLVALGGALWLISTILSTAEAASNYSAAVFGHLLFAHLLMSAVFGGTGVLIGAISASLIVPVAIFSTLEIYGGMIGGGLQTFIGAVADKAVEYRRSADRAAEYQRNASGTTFHRAAAHSAFFTGDTSHSEEIHSKLLQLDKSESDGFDHFVTYNGKRTRLSMAKDGCPILMGGRPQIRQTNWVAVKMDETHYDLYEQSAMEQHTRHTTTHPVSRANLRVAGTFIQGAALLALLESSTTS